MKKIQFASDLHLEFSENAALIKQNPILPKGEILLLAGDIVPFRHIEKHMAFFEDLAQKFELVLWIPGNHEYYGTNIRDKSGIFEETILPNVKLVNNYCYETPELKIVMGTLWSQITDRNAFEIKRRMNDFHQIRGAGGRLSIEEYNAQFEIGKGFIQKHAKKSNAEQQLIVATHHVPTFENYPQEYRNDPLNEGFATEMGDWIEASAVDFWIYGHHHRNVVDFEIGNCKLRTNQLGYVAYRENADFDLDKILTT